MKLKTLLKYALPILSVTVVAIILPIALVSCSKTQNTTTKTTPKAETSPKLETKELDANALTISKEKLANFSTNLDKVFKTKKMKIYDVSNVSVVIDYEENVLKELGIPQSMVKKIRINPDFEQNHNLWKLEIELTENNSFDQSLIQTATNFTHKTFVIQNNKLDFYFESPFDYVAVRSGNNEAKNFLEQFVNTISLPPEFESSGSESKIYLNSDYKWFLEKFNKDSLAKYFENIEIKNLHKDLENNNEVTYKYDLSSSLKSPFIWVDQSNNPQCSSEFKNLTYKQINLNFESIKSNLLTQIKNFSEKTKTISNDKELDEAVKNLNQSLSQLILKKDSGVFAVLKQTELKSNKSYNLVVSLPAKYKLSNMLHEPTVDGNEEFVRSSLNNRMEYMGLIETAIQIKE